MSLHQIVRVEKAMEGGMDFDSAYAQVLNDSRNL